MSVNYKLAILVYFVCVKVWTHLDNGSCAGQAIGVRTRMDNGLSGFIPTKLISDKHISSPQERVKVDSASFSMRIHILHPNFPTFFKTKQSSSDLISMVWCNGF